MRAIVRGIPSSYEKGLAKYFGTGPTDIEEAMSQHKSYVKKVFLVYLQDSQQPGGRNDCSVQILSFSFFGAEL